MSNETAGYELGEKAMTIIPLVRQNGSSTRFMAHPFWSPIEQTLTIEAGGYYPLNLSTSYIEASALLPITDQ